MGGMAERNSVGVMGQITFLMLYIYVIVVNLPLLIL